MKLEYANLLDRVKAAVVDSIIIIAMMFAATEILALFEKVPVVVRVLLFVFIFILYEPIMLSMYGATIGHSKIGITVRKSTDTTKKISLFTVTANEKRKAIHDFIADTVVIKDI